MGLNVQKYLKTRFEIRTAEVEVDGLGDFFPSGEKAVWRVRGLTGQEVGQTRQAAVLRRDLGAVIDGLLGASSSEKAQAVKEMMHLNGEVPEDVVKRIATLTLGSVDPPGSEELSVRLCENHPIEFYNITNKILLLTGMGKMPGKQEPSGTTPKSGLA